MKTDIPFLPRSDSKAMYVGAMACYSWALASLVRGVIRLFSASSMPAELFPLPIGGEGFARMAFSTLIFAPVTETLLLVAIIEVLRRLRAPVQIQFLVPVVLIAALHSVHWLPWGLIVAPSFAIYAFSYIYWRTNPAIAAALVASIHSLHNLIPTLSTAARMIHA